MDNPVLVLFLPQGGFGMFPECPAGVQRAERVPFLSLSAGSGLGSHTPKPRHWAPHCPAGPVAAEALPAPSAGKGKTLSYLFTWHEPRRGSQ